MWLPCYCWGTDRSRFTILTDNWFNSSWYVSVFWNYLLYKLSFFLNSSLAPYTDCRLPFLNSPQNITFILKVNYCLMTVERLIHCYVFIHNVILLCCYLPLPPSLVLFCYHLYRFISASQIIVLPHAFMKLYIYVPLPSVVSPTFHPLPLFLSRFCIQKKTHLSKPDLSRMDSNNKKFNHKWYYEFDRVLNGRNNRQSMNIWKSIWCD